MCDLLSSTAGKIFPRLHVILLLMIVIFHVSLSKMNPLFDEKKHELKSIYHTFIFEDTLKKLIFHLSVKMINE